MMYLVKKQKAQLMLTRISHSLKRGGARVSFSDHFKKRVRERNLVWSPDALNVIHGGSIVSDGQVEKKSGQFRYRIETKQMVLIVEFLADDWIRCISGWRKRK